MTVTMHRQTIDSELDRAASRWADRVGRRVVAAAQRRCPVDEGALRTSISFSVIPTGSRSKRVIIGSPLEYAVYVHEGTGIYGPKGTPIVPLTAKALKFKPSGALSGVSLPKGKRGVVFAKSVAGVPPRPFLAQGLNDVLGSLPTFVTSSTL